MKKSYPLVSVVLPSYNAMSTLNGCLDSLIKTNYPNFEIIVIDDHSTDGTYEKIKSYFLKNKKNIKIFRNSRNREASYTRNRGIKESKGKYIAFAETDMEFDPDWLNDLVLALEAKKELGAVAGKNCDLDNKDTICCVGVLFDPATFGVVNIGKGEVKNKYGESCEIGLGSVGTLFRKDVINEVGGYDEKFGHNIDDIELSWRMWVQGYPQISIPSSITYHKVSKKASDRSLPMIRSEIINNKVLRVFIKNYEFKSLLKYVPLLIFYQILRIVENIFWRGNLRPLVGFLGGYIWNIVNLGDSLAERKKIQSKRKLTDDQIISRIGYKKNYLLYVSKMLNS